MTLTARITDKFSRSPNPPLADHDLHIFIWEEKNEIVKLPFGACTPNWLRSS